MALCRRDGSRQLNVGFREKRTTIVTNLVHAARGSNVAMVMVEDRLAVKDGRLADTRWEGLNARARRGGLDLRGSAGRY